MEDQKTSVEEKIKRFKELVKQGYSVNKALKEVKLSPTTYNKHRDEIWSDPEMAPFKPKNPFKKPPSTSNPPPQNPSAQPDQSKPSGEQSEVKGLEDLLGEELHPFEKQFLELEKQREALIQAAYRVLRGSVGRVPQPLGAPPATQATQGEAKVGSPVDDFLDAFKKYEDQRQKIREALEKMGFKLEDKYVSREEVERLIEEARRKAAEEALDDKRLAATERIMEHAIDRIIEFFAPAVQAFMPPRVSGVGAGSQVQRESGSQAS